MYELTLETAQGRQVALNRKNSTKAIYVWIESCIDPHRIGLRDVVSIKAYPKEKPRAHLSASRLTGPITADPATPSGTLHLRRRST